MVTSERVSLSEAQRWVLAVPWHAVLRWRAPWDRFGLVPRPARSGEALHTLERQWNIVTPDDVERTLASLEASANVRDAAWPLSNAVLVAELAFAGFLLDEVRAWQAAVSAARALQRHHRGWFSMAEGYLRGLAVNRPESSDEEARQFLIDLHARPDSPWNTLAWATELPETIPPPGPMAVGEARARVVEADGDDGLIAALATAAPVGGLRIRLHPGEYVGPFELDGCTLERVEHAPLGSVIFTADEGPALITRGGVELHGLVLRAAVDSPAIVHEGAFLRVVDCRFEGGLGGLEADASPAAGPAAYGATMSASTPPIPPILQIEVSGFEGHADSAVSLTEVTCRARDISIAAVGSGFVLERARLTLCDAFIESAERAGLIARGGELHLRRVRVHDAELWGVSVIAARADLHDVEVMRSIVGLHAAEAAIIAAERCRFSDASTANIELLDIAQARFVDCHVTGGEWAGVWLHPGHGASFKGGQIGGSKQACAMIEGGKDVALAGVGIGPSQEGGGLFISHDASVRADGVFVSGATTAGVELRQSALVAHDLRVRGSAEGVLLRDGARLEGHRLDLADIRGTALWLASGKASVAGLGLRKVGFGVVVGPEAVALAQNLVCAHTPVAAQVEGGRLALAGRLGLGGGAVRVKGGSLAARGLEATMISAHDGELYLESGSLTAPGALDVQGHSRLVLAKVALAAEALVSAPDCEVVLDPSHQLTVMSPLFVALPAERFHAWGKDPSALGRIIDHLLARLGLGELVVARAPATGVRIDGALPTLTRIAPALGVLMAELGALGVALAELLAPPTRGSGQPGGPRGLA